ncbi:predicted protein [Meyerozyma guilliermondii ATCC 6260]|uniref:Uncharacterized protein n=1 Tax=Meyerozyma guilliermondii (strain ATCC 6260 / CBS 566 / DSM 6381 / JCM 1539 / NBRC 10279 / NRRL Y-324) TaxID=294746 RepID=A5DMJ4_PICGU|nr:uncharacterized protein PGUG_04495 [Meyerozyma guilliermondii ATCC 6260]EDK40397.2 predicted protein [Meyerozyma guilliermondii ATCC 6260]
MFYNILGHFDKLCFKLRFYPSYTPAIICNYSELCEFNQFLQIVFLGHFLPDPVPLFAAAARTTAHTPHPLHKSPSAVFLNPRKQPQKRPCASISLTYCLCHLLPPVSRTLLPPHFHTPVLVSSKSSQSIFQIEQRTTSTHIKSTIKNHKLKSSVFTTTMQLAYPHHPRFFIHPPFLSVLWPAHVTYRFRTARWTSPTIALGPSIASVSYYSARSTHLIFVKIFHAQQTRNNMQRHSYNNCTPHTF